MTPVTTSEKHMSSADTKLDKFIERTPDEHREWVKRNRARLMSNHDPKPDTEAPDTNVNTCLGAVSSSDTGASR